MDLVQGNRTKSGQSLAGARAASHLAPMLFARRALQRRLTELRPVLGDATVDGLAARLNAPGRDRLATAWEVAILHALAPHGRIAHEQPLASGRRPDLGFDGAVRFTADVTCVSDEGLDRKNPYDELSDLLEQLKGRLGLPIGGMDLQIEGRNEETRRGTRTLLRLPDRARLAEFVRREIEPELRRQRAEGRQVLALAIDDGDVGLRIIIDPAKSPINTGGHPAYDTPTIKDRNPLFNALRDKARQLKTADGITGIIVCDGDCTALRDRSWSWNAVRPKDIIADFLRQNSSVQFVLALSVREETQSWPRWDPPKRELDALYVPSRHAAVPREIPELFRTMLAGMPKPVVMPVNAAHRAREQGYGLGHHGGHRMSGNKLRIGARELVELLAGRRTVAEMNEAHGWYGADGPAGQAVMPNPFERLLREGRLPASIEVQSGGEDASDDWVEIAFGERDAAVGPFR